MAQVADRNRIFEGGLPSAADLDDPLAQEFQWPEKVWGLGSKKVPYICCIQFDPEHAHLSGWSPVFCSQASCSRFHGIELRQPLGVQTEYKEIPSDAVIEWAHPQSFGIKLLEFDGSEIARVAK